jgi:hypothetical protein
MQSANGDRAWRSAALAKGELTAFTLCGSRSKSSVFSPQARERLAALGRKTPFCFLWVRLRDFVAVGSAHTRQRLLGLGQSCSLPSVTLTPTYRRSLISPLPSVINAWLNGQLVPPPLQGTEFLDFRFWELPPSDKKRRISVDNFHFLLKNAVHLGKFVL